MFYGFNLTTLKCHWSIDHKPNVPNGMVVIETETVYNIANIQLDNTGTEPAIVTRIETEDERIALLKEKRSQLLASARTEIDDLTDVVEFTEDDKAVAKLAEWREYRANLYVLTIDSPDDVEWPEQPTPLA